MTGAIFLIDDNPVARARRFIAGMPYRIPAGDGTGYLAGEFPDGITTVEGVPVSATVRILYRPEPGAIGDGTVVAEVQSAPNGSWQVTGLNPDLRYDVVGRLEGRNDVIVAGVTPTSMVEITYSGAVVENETFTGAEGYIELVGGLPPYSAAAETPLPSGLFPVISGRNLIIDGTTGADEVASFDVKVTSSNGAEKVIPLQLVVGFKAPQNLASEVIFDGGVFSVALTWEVTNTTQQIKVYRSATPFDMDDLPEPIATLSGTPTTYTDGDVIEDDHFYYMVAAVCEQHELDSEAVAVLVTGGDPHWDNVVALLHFDGDIVDLAGREWVVTGSPTFTPAPAKFGQSIYLPDRNTRLQTDANPLVSLESFTIETFFCIPSGHGNPTDYHAIAGQTNSGGAKGQTFWARGGSGSIGFSRGSNVGSAVNLDGVTTVLDDVVYHAALTYDYPTGKLRLFLDGNLEAEADNAVGWIPENRFTIGAYINTTFTTYGLYGYLDEFRITKGVARYTENFTPPTKPFPNK